MASYILYVSCPSSARRRKDAIGSLALVWELVAEAELEELVVLEELVAEHVLVVLE